MRRAAPAFTLIELLVVIAILGLLAALLLPALSQGRDQAKATLCRSNLSQLGKALIVYTTENGKYPGTRTTPAHLPPQAPEDWGGVWDYRLRHYVSANEPIFHCPSDKPGHAESGLALTNYTYGYNAYGSGVLPPQLNLGLGHAQSPETPSSRILEIRESEVTSPDDMIAIGDLTDHPQVFTTAITPGSLPPYAGGPAGRHRNGANMVFCDGHVQLAKQPAWIEQTDAARRRWNHDHQPHPESWR